MNNLALIIFYHLNNFAATCSGGTVTTSQGQTIDTCLPTVAADGNTLKTILQLVFGLIGAIAIIYIMYGAFRFVRSQGDPKEVTQARQTIIFAVLGLVIAIAAQTIVAFALGRF